MSYSWRAIKESSALISAVLTKKIDDNILLDKEDFVTGGEILLSGLADIRHRGAFSAISPSYIAVCETCFESCNNSITVLPEIWLMVSFEPLWFDTLLTNFSGQHFVGGKEVCKHYQKIRRNPYACHWNPCRRNRSGQTLVGEDLQKAKRNRRGGGDRSQQH